MADITYEMTIGLEVHIELKTATKIFCGCKTDYGAPPNTQCCPVCMGMPGTLPVLNEKAVALAVRAGIAVNCAISPLSKLDRKHYFYPDLPKGYQISQHEPPLCENGYLDIEGEHGTKRIGISRIHIEEDTGKLLHDDAFGTFIDFNRCGIPLIEVVSKPEIHSAHEARAYLKKLRAIMIYAGISDCKMNEGSLRCDVNLSVRKAGDPALGARTEIKNLNSFRFAARAIEYEYQRQADTLRAGNTVARETRGFDPASGMTYPMRRKETEDDYRFFPDPDLPPIKIDQRKIARIKGLIPPLPDERKRIYTEQYGLSPHDGEAIAADLSVADCFEKGVLLTDHPKVLANLLMGEVFRLAGADTPVIGISPEHLAKVAQMQGEQRINSAVAKTLTKQLWEQGFDPEAAVEARGLGQINDRALLRGYVRGALEDEPMLARDYRGGKRAAFQAIVGRVMSKTGGRGNPVIIGELIREELPLD